jgi:hypothetical protein
VTFLEKFVKTVKSKCEIIFKRFGSFRDVVSNNKSLYATRFCVNWAFLIAGEARLKYERSEEPRCINNYYDRFTMEHFPLRQTMILTTSFFLLATVLLESRELNGRTFKKFSSTVFLIVSQSYAGILTSGRTPQLVTIEPIMPYTNVDIFRNE